MKIDFQAKGLDKARNMMDALGKMGAAHRAISLGAMSRKGEGESGTNADVKENLALGGRDIGPNEEDARMAAEAYVKQAEKFMRMQTDAKKPPSAQAANQASKLALKMAADVVSGILVERVEKSEDKDGKVVEVSEDYAKWRSGKFSMPDDQMIVFRASGQLLSNLASKKYKYHK